MGILDYCWKMSLEDAQVAAVEEHNRLRALHEDTEPLELASDLCEEAQVYNLLYKYISYII